MKQLDFYFFFLRILIEALPRKKERGRAFTGFRNFFIAEKSIKKMYQALHIPSAKNQSNYLIKKILVNF